MTTTTTDAGNGARASLPTEVAEVADAFSNAWNRECANCEEQRDADGFRYCDACGQTTCESCNRYYGCPCGAEQNGYYRS